MGAGGGGSDAPYVVPVLDGIETDFFEWRDAARYRATGGSGTMHRASGNLLEVRYGTDGSNLHVRADLAEAARGDRANGIALLFPGPQERRVRLPLGAGAGPLSWAGEAGSDGVADAGEFAVGETVEIRIPLTRLRREDSGVAEPIRFQVALERDSRPEEVAPSSGWFLLRAMDQNPRLTHWSAL